MNTINYSILFVFAAALITGPPMQLVGADLSDNQIEDSRAPVRLGRPYEVRNCPGCEAGKCMVMGMQRFAEPRCEAYSGLGSPCRMWQEPENKTLNFPNGILMCNDVYMQFCPCAPGLVCEEAECRRQRGPQRDVLRQDREERASFGENDDDDDNEEDEYEMMPVALEPSKTRYDWAVARFHH